jgi:hypothetical protein
MGPDPPVVYADGTIIAGMKMVESTARPATSTAGRLVLFTGTFFPTTGVAEALFDSAKQNIPTLNRTPGTFQLLTSAQDQQFSSQRPFFYAGKWRVFFVTPHDPFLPPREWPNDDHLDPGSLDQLRKPHHAALAPAIPDPAGPVPDSADRLASQPAHPRAAGAAQPLTSTPPADSTPRRTLTATVARPADAAGFTEPPDARAAPTAATGDYGAILNDPGGNWCLPIYRSEKRYRFEEFVHPYICLFVRAFNRDGIDGLLQRPTQLATQEFFDSSYGPLPVVDHPYPKDEVDFSYRGAYSLYNWELFFHIPLLIADRLRQNQRFEEAQHWFHYIFDPTATSQRLWQTQPPCGETDAADQQLGVPQRYWQTRPFYETAGATYQQQQIQNLLQHLAEGAPDANLKAQINDWRANPFKPHAIARLRTTAYQKTVVMKYLDNLIQWGDQLFSRDTIESINEATQLYILAADILGRRPHSHPPRATAQVHTFNTIQPQLDCFSNALVQIEAFIPPSAGTNVTVGEEPPPTMLYFCVPENDKLLGYWDTVADRLFKIRHCMNIEGVIRQLPLFEPPIDPALLVQAAAAGVDISSVLNDVNAAMPHHRFTVMTQKAGQLCADLKNLGAALLAALEKRDAEALALLRSTHEISVLKAARTIRQRQIDEAERTLEGLQKSRDTAQLRLDYYHSIPFINPAELMQAGLAAFSLYSTKVQADLEVVAATVYGVPDVKMGAATTIGGTTGGSNLGAGVSAHASAMGATAGAFATGSAMAGTLASYQRRFDDWKLQERLAAKEIEQLDQQITAAEIRLAIAERELQNHDIQIEQAAAVDDLMRNKYTNRELYEWTIGQIAGIYFQSYQIAYDLAQRAERAFRFELGLQESSYIQFGYWDSLKKGLLAGERLYLDLQRMEAAYLDQRRREYELTRHISLAQLDPEALVQLRQTGECFVSLPEALFDLDCPGHYLRRIQSVSLSIPCVTGPYTSVNCTLTQLKSSIRYTSIPLGEYARHDPDPRFADTAAAQSIVTSGAQDDSGVFELNLHDDRYLPFEGTGAISDWHLQLANEFRQFDYDTIADVVLHLRYTARDGGEPLKQQAITALKAALAHDEHGAVLLISARRDLSSEWSRFLNPLDAAGDQTLPVALILDRIPLAFATKNITFNKIELFVKARDDLTATYETTLKLALAAGTDASDQALALAPWNGLLRAEWTGVGKPGDWTLTAWLDGGAGHERLDPDALEDLLIVGHYTLA